jgi:integrase/recombinase XerC
MFLDTIKKFLEYLQFEKRYSHHTISNYEIDLQEFYAFIGLTFEITALEEVRAVHIRNWMAAMLDKSLHPNTVKRKRSALNSFYKYCNKNNIVKTNPTSALVVPKSPKPLPQFVEQSKMDHLFDKDLASIFPANEIGQQHKLIIDLFYQTGMRLSELLNLKINDIDFSRNSVKVLGKRNKERIIPLGADFLVDLKQYIHLLESSQVFLFEINGKPLYPKYVQRLVKKYLSLITTIQKKSPHVLRHTFATHMLNGGAELIAVKELLGHSSLAATQVYTHSSIEQLKKSYTSAHPRNN